MIERLFARAGRQAGRRAEQGERLGGYVYGTIVVLATIVGGAKAYRHGAGHVALLVVLTTVVFWLGHVYSDALGDSIRKGKRMSWAELMDVAGRESSIIEAAVAPVLVLVLGRLGVLSVHTAVWLAFLAGIAVLVTEGFALARIERLSIVATLVIVAANLVVGLSLVALELWVGH